jgi:hypothetical protein
MRLVRPGVSCLPTKKKHCVVITSSGGCTDEVFLMPSLALQKVYVEIKEEGNSSPLKT